MGEVSNHIIILTPEVQEELLDLHQIIIPAVMTPEHIHHLLQEVVIKDQEAARLRLADLHALNIGSIKILIYLNH